MTRRYQTRSSTIQERTYRRIGDFTTDKRVLFLSLLAVPIGIVSSFVAYGLLWLIAVITNFAFFQRYSSTLPSLAELDFRPWMIGIPIVGGLVIGVVARFGSEKIRGHGIPEALEAILIGRSKVEAKVAVLKPTTSALAIGTGGPFGAEGPIIMTGGALGSLFAQFFRLSSAERKTLLVAGAAAGMTAVFNTPVGAVLLAVELLLFEWRPRSFIPVVAASAVAAVMRVPLLGAGPVFPVVPHGLPGATTTAFALAVGFAVGIGASLVTGLVYLIEDLFKKLPIHWMWWPAIGGLAVGLIGMFDPRVLGVGYDNIESMLAGNGVALALAVLLFAKAGVWSIALSSGTSGGVLAPLLIMGGALGALLSFVIPVGDLGLWAMVGMAAMMGGAMGAPLTSTVFVVELTHDLNPFLAVLVASVAAHAVTVLLMRRSILTEKLARRDRHVAREYRVDPYEVIRVKDTMDATPVTIQSTMAVADLAARITDGDQDLAHRQGFPVVDEGGNLVGVITRGDVLRALRTADGGQMTVLAAGNDQPLVCYPEEPLDRAINTMVDNNVGRLLVVDPVHRQKLLGYIGRSGILAVRKRHYEEESVRERLWGSARRVP